VGWWRCSPVTGSQTRNAKRAASIAALALAAAWSLYDRLCGDDPDGDVGQSVALALCVLATMAFMTRSFQALTLVLGRRRLDWRGQRLLSAGQRMFVAAVGLTLIISVWFQQRSKTASWRHNLFAVLTQGAILSVAFALVLVPWTVRNWRRVSSFPTSFTNSRTNAG